MLAAAAALFEHNFRTGSKLYGFKLELNKNEFYILRLWENYENIYFTRAQPLNSILSLRFPYSYKYKRYKLAYTKILIINLTFLFLW